MASRPKKPVTGPSPELNFQDKGWGRTADAGHGHYTILRNHEYDGHSNYGSVHYRPKGAHDDKRFAFANDAEGAHQVALYHHVIKHYGISPTEASMAVEAYGHGAIQRFHGAHPDMVQAQLNRAKEHLKKTATPADPMTGGAQSSLVSQPMEPTIGGGGDPILTDPKVKRFLTLLGGKMVENQFEGSFKPGDRVIHPYLGMGRVTRVHDPVEADPKGGLLYDVRYPEFDIALNQIELVAVPPPPVNPIAVPIKSNMRAVIPTAPPHPALQAMVSMAPSMPAVAQAQQEEQEAKMEAMKEGADAEGSDEEDGSEGGDEGGGSDDSSPFGKSELAKARVPKHKPARKLEWTRTPEIEAFDGRALERWEAKGHHHYTIQRLPNHYNYHGNDSFTLISSKTGTGSTWRPIKPSGNRVSWSGKHYPRDHRSLEGAQQSAQKHHIVSHYGLKDHEVAAVEHAWPDQGVHRFANAHPDMVRQEVARAVTHHKESGDLEKAKRKPATEAASELSWHQDSEDGNLHHAYAPHGLYEVYRGPGGHPNRPWEASYRTHSSVSEDVTLSREGSHSRTGRYIHHSLDEAKKAAEHHHALKHYGLGKEDRDAIHQAWPTEGPRRFIGKHPEMVRAEVERAKGHFKKSELEKRSKNVRRQVRNIDDDQAAARVERYAMRQGLDPEINFGVGKNIGVLSAPNKIRWNALATGERRRKGDTVSDTEKPQHILMHEVAHAVNTPGGVKLSDRQEQLDQMSNERGAREEGVTSNLEPKIARRAGIQPINTRTSYDIPGASYGRAYRNPSNKAHASKIVGQLDTNRRKFDPRTGVMQVKPATWSNLHSRLAAYKASKGKI